MSKHTPGPWSVLEGPDGTGDVRVVSCLTEIAEVDGPLLEVQDANARLIAAAPDTLRVTKVADTTSQNVLAYFREHLVNWPDDLAIMELQEQVEALGEIARAAIAKAEGDKDVS